MQIMQLLYGLANYVRVTSAPAALSLNLSDYVDVDYEHRRLQPPIGLTWKALGYARHLTTAIAEGHKARMCRCNTCACGS